MKDFKRIVFGKTDAQEEGAEYPELLIKGYLPIDNINKQVLETNKFLFLGYKGSGKSALSEHLKLTSDANTLVDQQSLKNFPYKTFSKIVSGDSEPEIKHKLAWRWLLLVRVLQGLVADSEAKASSEIELRKTIELLTQAGLFEVTNISDMVKKTSSNSFKVSIKAFAFEHTTHQDNADISLDWVVEYVKRLIAGYKESCRHMLVIDGVDEILTTREIQYQSVVAMINESKDLNIFFQKNSLPIKIIILCRTDIFERLPDPNKNKIRRDCSYSFNWYKEGNDTAEESDLVKIANKRTRLVYPDVKDMFDEFFPPFYNRGDIRSEMLELTRHTPRDFLQLLVSIQKNCNGENVKREDIDRGVADYSLEYFLPEIKDEMAGYIPYTVIDSIVNILASFRSREFSFSNFDVAVKKSSVLLRLSSIDILKVLYDCSAIGHVYPYGDGSHTRITFKYRNRNSSFTPNDRIILHKGLWKGLNVNY